MKAAILFAAREPLQVGEVAIDRPRSREVLVQVAASGLCHSDWHYVSGDLPPAVPVVLGHEVAGIVAAVGPDVTAVAVGDHVTTCALVFCGHCDQCVSGRSQTCTDRPARAAGERPRLTLDGKPVTQGSRVGGFAETVLLHENSMVPIDRSMPLDRAAVLGCGVLTGTGAVFHSAKVTPGSRVVVIGCGGVGLTIVQAARIAGARQIVAIDANPAKEAMARKFGATEFIVAGDAVIEEVRDLTRGGAEFVFEAIGLPKVISQGIRMLAINGLLTVVGATPAGRSFEVPGLESIFNEWRIQGTFFGSSAFVRDIPMLIDLYQRGLLDLDNLVSDRIALDEVNQGFANMLSGATPARNVIVFDDVLAQAAAHA